MVTLELEIPPRSAYVGVVRLALASLARVAGLTEDAIDDVKIAVSEACANAVLASEMAGVDDPVHVSVHEDADRLVIEIKDRGAVRQTEDESIVMEGTETSQSAMSLALIRSLMSDCEIDRTGDGYNLTRLVVAR